MVVIKELQMVVCALKEGDTFAVKEKQFFFKLIAHTQVNLTLMVLLKHLFLHLGRSLLGIHLAAFKC